MIHYRTIPHFAVITLQNKKMRISETQCVIIFDNPKITATCFDDVLWFHKSCLPNQGFYWPCIFSCQLSILLWNWPLFVCRSFWICLEAIWFALIILLGTNWETHNLRCKNSKHMTWTYFSVWYWRRCNDSWKFTTYFTFYIIVWVEGSVINISICSFRLCVLNYTLYQVTNKLTFRHF